MRIIRYGFFGEDDAQQLFLKQYLAALATGQAWGFVEDAEFPLKGGSKSRVKAQFDEACELGLSYAYRHDCFFVGLDLDDHDEAAFRETVQQMSEKLRARDVAAILLIPVQCIEHWLWYLKWHALNPTSTKNENLESKPRSDAKLAVYNAKKCSTKYSNPIVEQIAAGMDINWLASHSTSFLAFHKQVENYLGALTSGN